MSESSLFNDIAQGLKEAIAYERGELDARSVRISCRFSEPPEWTAEEIKRIRLPIPMGVSVKTVEAWENGRNHPSGSAARLMQIIAKDWDSSKFISYTRP